MTPNLLPALLALALPASATIARPEDAPPAQALTPVPIQSVQIDDPFWSPKLHVWRQVTVPDCLNKFDRDGAMANFDHVARGELAAKHGGAPWYDGLIYEMIRAAGDFLAEQPDPALEARIDGMIDRISAAADHDPDGYLNTYTQMKEPTHRWGQNDGNDRWQHDLYNAGCMVDAGVHYYRGTGKTKLLETAVRLANLMCRVMGPPPRQNIIPGHAVGEEALVGLYQLFKEQPDLQSKLHVAVKPDEYLALAKFWIDARGHHEGRTDFGACDQDDVPVLQQNDIEGHAVRATLMASGLTKLGMATGSRDYADAALRLWRSMTGRRMYLTGGVGSFANDEKFGPDYVLPNNGYAETCAAVGNGFFDRNINLATGDAAAVDELERALYNGALSGVSLSGNTYFYENPLQAGPRRTRWEWHACPCCPPMFLKLMSALPGYIDARSAQPDAPAVYVNLFIGSREKLSVADTPVTLTQTTHYPWTGDVRLAISPAHPAAFDVNLRIPDWARGSSSPGGLYTWDAPAQDAWTITLNGHPIPTPQLTNGYAPIHRTWSPGDVLELHLSMPPRRVRANEHIEADRGRVALMRGPLVYCLESIDNDKSLRGLTLPLNATIKTEDRPTILGGVTVLHANGHRATDDKTATDAEITAIPYYANANRGPVQMEVWIPTGAADVR